MSETPPLGFIGLGVMGEPMCRNMLRRLSPRMSVFDLQDEPVQRMVEEGAKAAGSVSEVAQAAEVVFLSLPGGPQVESVIEGRDGFLPALRPGQIVVDLSTSPLALTRRLAATLAERGVAFADAPVARTRAAAERGELSVMVGGDPETFAAIRPWLAATATEITHCGGVGAGQIVKLMNNMVLFETVVALAEALNIGRENGVDPEVLFKTLAKGSADSFALRNHGMHAMIPGDFPEGAFATDYAMKDIGYALDMAEQAGIDAAGARLARRLLERSSRSGHGREYFPVLVKILQNQSSRQPGANPIREDSDGG